MGRKMGNLDKIFKKRITVNSPWDHLRRIWYDIEDLDWPKEYLFRSVKELASKSNGLSDTIVFKFDPYCFVVYLTVSKEKIMGIMEGKRMDDFPEQWHVKLCPCIMKDGVLTITGEGVYLDLEYIGPFNAGLTDKYWTYPLNEETLVMFLDLYFNGKETLMKYVKEVVSDYEDSNWVCK